MESRTTKCIDIRTVRGTARHAGFTNGLTNGNTNGLPKTPNGRTLRKSPRSKKKHGKILAERRGLWRGRSPILAIAVLCFLVLGVFAVLTYQSQQKNIIAIDGNFDDWQSVAKQSKERMNDVPENIDIAEYASTESGRNVAFYAKVYGNMLYGDGRYIVEVPNENPVYIAEIRENAIPNVNGKDVAYVFIDTDNNANTGFKPSDKFAVGADKAIEILGKNGKIEASRVLEFAGTVPYEWNWIVKQSVDSATNGKQMETMASKSVLGVGEKYAVYFYMVDWQGKECKVENALKCENAKVSGFVVDIVEPNSEIKISKRTAHPKIHINGNDDFASQAANESWSGNGTQDNPYVIEGYAINGDYDSYCIWIENTTVWFVIRNCTLWNTLSSSAPFGSGICIKNVQNGTIDNNTCYNNYIGIYVTDNSNNTVITNNNCTKNVYYGIKVYAINSVVVMNNTVVNCGTDGICLCGCTNSIISNNNCSHNPSGIQLASANNNYITNNHCTENNEGIALSASANNTITNNYFSNNMDGIYLYSGSSYNDIRENNCSGNSVSGIYLSSSNNNTITNNTCNSNSYYGICLSTSSYNTIMNNDYYDNRYGIFLWDGSVSGKCTDNIVINNELWNNGIVIQATRLDDWNTHTIENNTVNGKPVYYYKNQTGSTVPSDAGEIILANCNNMIISGLNLTNASIGVLLGFSSYNTVTNNNCSNNAIFGVYLSFSDYNNITYNDCANTNCSIHLNYSNNNEIRNNICTNNTRTGIYVWGGSSNNIANNNCSGNAEDGMYFFQSDHNTITNNNCSSNMRYGIRGWSTIQNTIRNNTCCNNSWTGMIWSYSSDCEMTNNTCSGNLEGGIISYSSYSNIMNNICSNNGKYGIYSSGYLVNILNNTCIDNCIGIYSDNSDTATIKDNTLLGNGIVISGNFLTGNYILTMENNTVNGKPVYYYKNQNGGTVPSDAGQVILANCTNMSITGLTISNASIPIQVGYSAYITITNNTFSRNSQCGISLYASTNNTITRNRFLFNSGYGISITSSSTGNTILRNNFWQNNGASKGSTDYRSQARDDVGSNYWYDNTTQEGNYWSNWDGKNWGTPDAYLIDGRAGAYDMYPFSTPVDATVPAPPQNLVAVAGNSKVTLTWEPPANDGGSPITGYKIYWGIASGNYSNIKNVGNVLTYTVTGLTNGQTYYFAVSALNAVGESAKSNEVNAIPHLDLTPHGPIHINGNADFANQAHQEGWAGDGTQGNPYIIALYEIDGNGGAYCIWIENTDVWFIVRECKVWNATDNTTEPFGTGITLTNVQNGKIEENQCFGNYQGIGLLDSSQYNTITNNNCSENFYDGIWLDSSDNNTIAWNTCYSNGYGIELDYSNYTWVMNNTCLSNSYYGICLYYACNNTLTNNNCSGNYWYGLFVYYRSQYNNITYNNFYLNTYYAIFLYALSKNNTIHHNNFWQNNGAGKGVTGNCQACDDVGGNYWYNNTAQEGNYWSNWDGQGWGTPNAYPIDGGAGAYDMYPLGNPTPELTPIAVIVSALGLLGIVALRKRK